MIDLIIGDNYASLDACLADLRQRYATHEQILELAATNVICTKTEWELPVSRFLEMILDDLGNCSFDAWDGTRNAIRNGLYFDQPNTSDLQNALQGPAICLAAGPTAHALLPIVRQNQDTHHIFACDAMAQACAKNGITPHFTVMLERTALNCAMALALAMSGSRLLAPPVVDPRAAQAFGGKVLWWRGSGLLDQWLNLGGIAAYPGKSCGVLSVQAALLAGCNPIYLVGHDLAYQDGRSHAESVHPIAVIDQGNQNSESHVFYGRRMQTTGSDGGSVETCGIWNQFRHDIEQIIACYPDRAVINCGGLSQIRGTLMGKMAPFRLMCREPEWPMAKRWKPDAARIAANIKRIKLACYAAVPTGAAEFLISKFVDADLALMFNHVFRPIIENLILRINYRVARGADLAEQQTKAFRLMVNTIYHLCERMEVDLHAA